jgi:hypothetical protein
MAAVLRGALRPAANLPVVTRVCDRRLNGRARIALAPFLLASASSSLAMRSAFRLDGLGDIPHELAECSRFLWNQIAVGDRLHESG